MSNKLLSALRKTKRHFIVKRFKRRLSNKDFTLITQNCVGGVMYSTLGLEFLSPTINMFIEDENFVKLVENLEYYMSVPATAKQDRYVDPIDNSIVYPKIQIDDIELCCLHYKDCNDAIAAWERRRKRVNLENVFVIANTWNMHDNNRLIERITKTKYKTVIFTDGNYPFKECIKLKGDFWTKDKRGIIRPNLTDYDKYTGYKYYEEQFDFVDWLNQK